MTGRKTVVADLKEAIKAEESLIRTLKTDIQIPRILQDNIDHTRAKIEKLQRELDSLLHRQQNLIPMLDDAEEHLKELNQELAIENKRAKVEQLLRLQDSIEDLQEEINS